MTTIVRLPITNAVLGSDYTGTITIGSAAVSANVILDTGSSTLAVQQQDYDPTRDTDAKTTKIAQVVQYVSGSWVGAVVQTKVGLKNAQIADVNLAVTYYADPSMFGKADGIFGLAYNVLDNAFLMPADTWKSRYDADQIQKGRQKDLDPYFSQLEQAGIVSNVFSFLTNRSIVSLATDQPETDPLNQGLFVIGGDMTATDLFVPPFTSIAVLHDQWYNTNLLGVQVGGQPVIPVSPGTGTNPNSVVDSGTNSLFISQPLYDKILSAFTAINPSFATALRKYSIDSGQGVDQTTINLAAWPDLKFTFQGSDGKPATLAVAPKNYWQFDAQRKGEAVVVISGDGGQLGGQSILGLPLFNGYYVVFDRSAGAGNGVINFAPQR